MGKPAGLGRFVLVVPITVALSSAAGAVSAVAAASPVSARESRIVEVTVFPDRAEVIREARVDLPSGASTVEFAGLPAQVEPDSLRVTGKGVAAVLGAVELKTKADEPAESPELIAARDVVQKIQREIAVLKEEDANAKQLKEYFASIQASTAKRESDNLAAGKADPNAILSIYALVRKGLADLSAEQIARNDKFQKLERDLQVAQAKLNAARPPGPLRTRSATLDVETKQAGALTLRLAYVSPGAMWRPAYRASIDPASGEIAFASEAVVRQATGEDWSGVALRLSTAAPARGVQPPELTSLLLRPIEVMAMKGRMVDTESLPSRAPMMEAKPASPEAGADQAAGYADVDASILEAGVVHSSYNVAFEVPGRSDVPADGTDHRVGLRQETLAGKISYLAVPPLNPSAFLVAKTQAPADYPLLAGPVRVFAAGAFLGSFPLNETAPREDLTVPFGIDNRITVKREPLPQERGERGVIGKEKSIVYAFRNTVENLRDQKVTVVVEDRVPVSEDERIKVEQEKETTAGYREVKDRPGILQWTLDLAPREKREILLSYTVRYPRDLTVPGLE